MDINNLLETALHSEDPYNQLRSTLRRLLDNGYEREALISDVSKFWQQLYETNREKDYELILVMLDSLAGWCSTSEKI